MNENTHEPDEARENEIRPDGGEMLPHTESVPETPPPATVEAAAPQPQPTPQPEPPHGPRVGTIVWGLVVLAIGLGVLAGAAGAHIDITLAAILLLGGSGVALVTGSIVSSLRRREQ